MDIRKALAVFCILAVIGIVGYVVYDSFRTVDEFSPVVTIECGEMILDEPYTIDPAKVYVERIRPGHQVNCPLTIKNTGAENCTYILSIVTPRPPQEGYEAYNLNTPVWAVLSAREMTRRSEPAHEESATALDLPDRPVAAGDGEIRQGKRG